MRLCVALCLQHAQESHSRPADIGTLRLTACACFHILDCTSASLVTAHHGSALRMHCGASRSTPGCPSILPGKHADLQSCAWSVPGSQRCPRLLLASRPPERLASEVREACKVSLYSVILTTNSCRFCCCHLNQVSK